VCPRLRATAPGQKDNLSPDKTGLLKAFLGGLPGPVAARLASAVETDRMLDGNGLPHSAILESLRPILKRDQFERTLTPLRLFCHPFQDLLTCAPRRAKQKAAIARGTLVPVWIWVQRLIPRETGDYVGDVKTLLLKHQVENAFARAAQFWPLAGAAITRALDGEAARVAAQSILGDAFAVEDAVEMALLLAAGAQVEKLAALLPKPVPSLQESLLWEVRGVYDAMTQSHPDAAPYVAVITMNRLARPWEALRLPLLVTRKNDDTLIAKTDMGLVGEILFGRMDSLKTSIEQTRHPLFNADRLMAEVRAFAELSSNIVKEIELKRDGEWGRRLLVERAMIGKVMEDFMDRAPREVAAALPMQKSSADFSRLVSAEKQEMAVRYARLVTGSRNFAAAASFGASQKASYDALCTTLQRYNEDLVNGLKSADPARALVANAQLALCAELTAILFSEEEADLLRRRGKAAQSAAA
jgi:hypothetical protein